MAVNNLKNPLPLKWLVIITSIIIYIVAPTISAQTKEDCLTCHSDNTLTMEKKGKQVSLFADDKVLSASAHRKLQCTACHTGFDAENVPHKENIQPINCLTCHKNAPVKHLFHPQMFKNAGKDGRDVNCKGCHGTHDVKNVRHSASTGDGTACAQCHNQQSARYSNSAHAAARENGIKDAPACINCHKEQVSFKSFQQDTVKAKLAQEKLCLSCHLNSPEVRERFSFTRSFIDAFENSVHGQALRKGNTKAPGCPDCHDAHMVQSKMDRSSRIFKANIPQTCAKCHPKIAAEYNESIHGAAIKKGNFDSPVCTDCHGEHNILRHNDPNSPVSYKNVSEKVCAQCHSSVKLSQKYGIASDRISTFKDSYHGLALKGGSAAVANCGSCHGVHNIKSSSDSSSTVFKGNLAKTCGKCHPGANSNFAVGKIHVQITEKEEPLLYWISNSYIILIFLTLGGMFLHNLLDFIKKAKIRKMKQRGLIAHEQHGHKLYLRMTLAERIQHFLLLSSFFTLVITGFMLRFPDAWWVRHIREFSESAFVLRSILHRVAAVVMVSASLFHMWYLAATKRGRQLFIDLLPRLKDATDAIGVLKFNIGLSNEKPKLDRFSYVEKAEYWALIWGTFVMTATGIAMWFDNTFIGMFTKLGWDVARTVHYYEAWLAFLSILIWHFYFVLFNPDIYPMSLAWIKGTITEEEMAEEHPLELERIKKQQSSREEGEKEHK
ncbi:MAG: cytochrome b/b6 domain-containing protein [Ignavibacteria bacterium]|nr:cytochrome b/b6 domain-containing protein [Ignavibacteria bacterium]